MIVSEQHVTANSPLIGGVLGDEFAGQKVGAENSVEHRGSGADAEKIRERR